MRAAHTTHGYYTAERKAAPRLEASGGDLTGTPGGPASPDDVRQALASLSDTDLLRLKQIGKLRSSGLPLTWEDLLNEALRRMLSGARRWPRSVPLVAVMVILQVAAPAMRWP